MKRHRQNATIRVDRARQIQKRREGLRLQVIFPDPAKLIATIGSFHDVKRSVVTRRLRDKRRLIQPAHYALDGIISKRRHHTDDDEPQCGERQPGEPYPGSLFNLVRLQHLMNLNPLLP